jgi:hypothetical protein
MQHFPTQDQINTSKTWSQLYEALNIKPRNTRTQKKVQEYCLAHFPDFPKPKCRWSLISDSDFTDFVFSSTSVRQVITKCEIPVSPYSYKKFNRRVKEMGLSVEHFTGMGHLKNRNHNFNTKPLEYYLVENCSWISSHALKLRLLRDGIFQRRCSKCSREVWEGKPIPIQLDHINGDNHDNRLENLRIICPNCHAQTPTYCGRNKKKKVKARTPERSFEESR